MSSVQTPRMEASTLTHAGGRAAGLLARRSPLLKLQGDPRLVAMIRAGHDHAFDVLFDRYHSRLLAFCRHMLRSTEDAEDVLQEVFVKAHAAMCADERPINVRPWLYRIARNRCLNHLRRPVPEGQDSMDVLVGEGGVTTADRVQKREDFRALIADVQCLPETQRTALLLRELDALSYDEIALTMETTVPAVKSLLVRARMSLAEATQSRQLTCGEVRLELAEAAEGLRKATGPVRHHIKRCEGCREYRGELRSQHQGAGGAGTDRAACAALPDLDREARLGWVRLRCRRLGRRSGRKRRRGHRCRRERRCRCRGRRWRSGCRRWRRGRGRRVGHWARGRRAAAGAGGLGGAFGAKAAATAATAALLTTGAVEVRQLYSTDRVETPPAKTAPKAVSVPPKSGHGIAVAYEPAPAAHHHLDGSNAAATEPVTAPVEPVAAEDVDRRRPGGPADQRRGHRRRRCRAGRRRNGRRRRRDGQRHGRAGDRDRRSRTRDPDARARAGGTASCRTGAGHANARTCSASTAARPGDPAGGLDLAAVRDPGQRPGAAGRALELEHAAGLLYPLGHRGEADVTLAQGLLAPARVDPAPVV